MGKLNPKNLKKKLKTGKIAEEAVLEFLQSIGLSAKMAGGDHDLTFSLASSEITVEVKYDVMAEKTGNIAIEYRNTSLNKPSGINKSKADLWCHCVNKDDEIQLYFCRTTDLKAYTKKVKPIKKILNAGDGNANIYLYPTTVLAELFVKSTDLAKFGMICLLGDGSI